MLAANVAAGAAKVAADAALVARLAGSARAAFHCTDDAARSEFPDEALKWSREASKYADAAVAAAAAAAKALDEYEEIRNSKH